MFRDEYSIFYTNGIGGKHTETLTRPTKISQLKKELNEQIRISRAPHVHGELKNRMSARIRKTEMQINQCPKCHKVKRTYKKLSSDKIREYTLKRIDEAKSKGVWFITAEDIAHQLGVRVHFVKQVFQQLNIDGILHKPQHHIPHDSNRDPMCNGYYSGWAADIYSFRSKEDDDDE